MKKTTCLLSLIIVIGLQSCKKGHLGTDCETPIAKTIKGTTNQTLGYNKHVQLDVNNDGVIDFSMLDLLVNRDDTTYLYLYATAPGPTGNKILVNNGAPDDINSLPAHPFSKDELIEPNQQVIWATPPQKALLLTVAQAGTISKPRGTWLNQTDKYLGFQFTANTKTYNGWVRLSFDAAHNEILVMEYGYTIQPGNSIKAGE